MSDDNVVNFSDYVKEGFEPTVYQAILLQLFKDSIDDEFDPKQIVILALDEGSQVNLCYQFDESDPISLISAKGFLDVIQSQATMQLGDINE